MKIRLDKYLCDQKNLSRKEARLMIFKGLAAVGDKVIKTPDHKIDTDIDKVYLNGEDVSYKQFVYIMLNKPKGVLSASSDPSRETVIDLVPAHLKRKNLFPVGRLDRDTTGLLIITDDGDFAHKVISPKSGITKRYQVLLDGDLPDNAAELFLEGVTLADKTKCMPARLFADTDNKRHCFVEIAEGKYHQIKRMFGVLELGVVELHRQSIGALLLDENLSLGEAKELFREDLDLIYK